MIENHRWDALADEDHTHHLTVQEYFHYKNKWWCKVPGCPLIIQKVKKKVSQVLSERGDPFLAIFGKNLRK